ncbi:hypothetical protein AXI76_gp051 [Pseudoalteromonas phage H101]|uniref:Uncharacterized protein n=1 Tax=Pseudoalteromonas phage H101 TaxID=1654919 RepID=A0A0H4INR5_9CAUD|nr:hypothetical protein AXI76_gp051 [Pseudoalteromonas phage H101]AKO60952.1 hypothetical protein [Pseudoalteromonas phage H101]
MENVVIFEDGKSGRGSKAKLIKRGNKRVLIEFSYYDYEQDIDVVRQEWFKLWQGVSKHSSCGYHKYNNKRKKCMYIHEYSNEFYSDVYMEDRFISDFREWVDTGYFEELYGDIV